LPLEAVIENFDRELEVTVRPSRGAGNLLNCALAGFYSFTEALGSGPCQRRYC